MESPAKQNSWASAKEGTECSYLILLYEIANWSWLARTRAKCQVALRLEQRFWLGQTGKTDWIGREDSSDRASRLGISGEFVDNEEFGKI